MTRRMTRWRCWHENGEREGLMKNRIVERIAEWILSIVVSRVQVGGNCGICGKWVPHALVPIYWPYTICRACTDPLITIRVEGKEVGG